MVCYQGVQSAWRWPENPARARCANISIKTLLTGITVHQLPLTQIYPHSYIGYTYLIVGPAIAQAVSRWLPPAAARVRARV
jgi:hypothetical protein